MTIGDQFELKIWNYVTGNVSKQGRIDLNRQEKEMRKMQILACDVIKEYAFIAINNKEILIFSIPDNRT